MTNLVAAFFLGGFFASMCFGVTAFFPFAILSAILTSLWSRVRILEEEVARLTKAPLPQNTLNTTPLPQVESQSFEPTKAREALQYEPSRENFINTPLLQKTEAILPKENVSVSEPVFNRSPLPPEKEEDSFFSRILLFFTTGNTIAKMGALLLFFGVAFLLKYVGERGFFPIEFRLVGAALFSLALLVVGWQMREKKAAYALILQGAGLGIFYLTTFISYKLYGLIPSGLAFAFMLFAVVTSTLLALVQDSRTFASVGVVGGFLAPLLASSGSGNYAALFTYFTFLNGGIFYLSTKKPWRELHLIGFVFTFVLSALCGVAYTPELFLTFEPFLILFFAMYLYIGTHYALKAQEGFLEQKVDQVLTFGVPFFSFILQSHLVKDFRYGLAISATVCAAIYLFLVKSLWEKQGEKLRFLVESYFAIGVSFMTLAIPFAFEGRMTSAIWALEACSLIWLGMRTSRDLPRYVGVLIMILSSFFFFQGESRSAEAIVFLNSYFLGTFLLFISCMLSSYFFFQSSKKENVEEWSVLSMLLLVYSCFWIGFGVFQELDIVARIFLSVSYALYPNPIYAPTLKIIFVVIFAEVTRRVSLLWQWPALGKIQRAVLPLSFLYLLSFIAKGKSPLSELGLVAWTFIFIFELKRLLRATYLFLIEHVAALFLFTFVVSWAIADYLDTAFSPFDVWGLTPWIMIPSFILLALISSKSFFLKSPLGPLKDRYLDKVMLPFLVFIYFISLTLCYQHNGDPGIVPYIPLLNPLDLSWLLSVLTFIFWYREWKTVSVSNLSLSFKRFCWIVGFHVFIGINSILLRSMYHYFSVPWSLDQMMGSNLVQAALSLYWSVTALALMVFSTRKKLRVAWFVGLSILIAVVLKLFVFDLAGTGTLTRIVSFIGSGLLLLLVGYLSPLPPEESK